MNKAVISSALALASLLAAPAISLAAAAPKFTTDVIVPNVSVGQFKLGESYAAVKKALPTGDCPSNGNCTYSHTAGATGWSINFLFARISAHSKPFLGEISLQTSTPETPLDSLKTANGIGLGSTAAQVKKAYPHVTGSTKAGYLTILGPGEHGTTFTLTKGAVTSISMQSVHFG